MRFQHWIMALVILSLIASGWYMTHLEDSVSFKYDIYGWHKPFGVLVLFLVVARIITRLFSTVPPLPDGMAWHEKAFSHLTHWSLYLLMFLVPASGYLMSGAAPNKTVPFFGLTMPDIVSKSAELAKFFHSIHVVIPYVLLGVIVLHLLGVIKHRFFDTPENNVLNRML